MGFNSISRREFLSGGAKGGAALLLGGGALGSVLEACGSSPSTSSAESKTIAVEIDEGQNAEPFLWFNSGMKAKFGVQTNIIGLPFVGQYEKIVAELVARSNVYDVLVFPPYFMGDFVAKGFLSKLTDFGPRRWRSVGSSGCRTTCPHRRQRCWRTRRSKSRAVRKTRFRMCAAGCSAPWKPPGIHPRWLAGC